MGHLSLSDLLNLRNRTRTDLWLDDVEPQLANPATQRQHLNLLQEIDAELRRRGYATT